MCSRMHDPLIETLSSLLPTSMSRTGRPRLARLQPAFSADLAAIHRFAAMRAHAGGHADRWRARTLVGHGLRAAANMGRRSMRTSWDRHCADERRPKPQRSSTAAGCSISIRSLSRRQSSITGSATRRRAGSMAFPTVDRSSSCANRCSADRLNTSRSRSTAGVEVRRFLFDAQPLRTRQPHRLGALHHLNQLGRIETAGRERTGSRSHRPTHRSS